MAGAAASPTIPTRDMEQMNPNGCSTCTTAGTENYERYKACNKKWYYQYDYRHTNGELFTCVAPTLEQCRAKRDNWLKMQEG